MNCSIIIPTWNSSSFILDCLNSIKSLSGAHLKIFVIDNCSTDGTLAKLNSFRSRNVSIQYVSQRDSGPAEALNTGLTLALADDSEIVGWLNSDDYYAPGAIDRAIAMFNEHAQIVMLYGLARHVDEMGVDLGAYPTLPPSTNIKQFSNGSFICQPTVFFRKEVIQEVGLLDVSLKTAFDFDYWLRIFNYYPRKKIALIDKIQAYSRLHDQCLTRKFRQVVALESMMVISRYLNSAPRHWIKTYINELCDFYPFIVEPDSLIDIIGVVLSKAKPLMTPVEYNELMADIRGDSRVLLSHRQLFVSIYSDGWAAKRTLVRLRYDRTEPRIVQLHCHGGWPISNKITIKIKASDGSMKRVTLDSQDHFTLTLEAPVTEGLAFATWTIEVSNGFIPKNFSKTSKDNRALCFKIKSLNLV